MKVERYMNKDHLWLVIYSVVVVILCQTAREEIASRSGLHPRLSYKFEPVHLSCFHYPS
jgi:hypothetical protein